MPKPAPRGRLRAGAVALLLSGVFSLAILADGSKIRIEVTTNRDRYLVGEWATVTVTKCNPTEQPITVIHACPCCHDSLYALDSAGVTISQAGFGCIPIVWPVTWEPGECKSEDYAWYQTSPSFSSGDLVAPGEYRMFHVWELPTFTTETTSQELIIDPDLQPTTSAFIDFETLPDGSPVPPTPVGAWYLSQNVTFYELGYGHRQPGFHTGFGSDGLFAQSTVTTYPSGFNVVAEYLVPVGHVSADVMTAAGYSVTMSAFDSSGQLVAAVESASSAELWKGRLALESMGGIARVEWFPSIPQATVGIDNLEFGPARSVVEIPALDPRGLAALVLLLMTAATIALRRLRY